MEQEIIPNRCSFSLDTRTGLGGAGKVNVAQLMPAETSEPIFRRRIMRLSFPRIKGLQTDDGTASIAFQSTSMDRDTGGYQYLFRYTTPSGEVEVRATVARVTGAPAGKKFLAETGTSLWSQKIQDAEKYLDEYAEEYGHTFEVRIFAVPSDKSGSSIALLRDTFCRLFLECWSSVRYNSADETSDPAACYPDIIKFVPYDVDRNFHVTLYARRRGDHD